MLLLTSRIQRKKRARESKERARVCCQREKKNWKKPVFSFGSVKKKKKGVAAALSLSPLSSLSLSPAALLIEPSWATSLLLTEKEKEAFFWFAALQRKARNQKERKPLSFSAPLFFFCLLLLSLSLFSIAHSTSLPPPPPQDDRGISTFDRAFGSPALLECR